MTQKYNQLFKIRTMNISSAWRDLFGKNVVVPDCNTLSMEQLFNIGLFYTSYMEKRPFMIHGKERDILGMFSYSKRNTVCHLCKESTEIYYYMLLTSDYQFYDIADYV